QRAGALQNRRGFMEGWGNHAETERVNCGLRRASKRGMATDVSIGSTAVHGRGWRVSRRVLVTLIGLVLLGIAARIALPGVLRRAIDHRLQAIPDYTGHVDDVDVSLWRGAYTLRGLVVQKRNSAIEEPFFRAREIDFSVAWRELFRGQFVSDIVATQPRLTFVAAPSPAASQMTADRRWQDAIADIFPIHITFLRIKDGELRYINRAAKPQVDVRVAHVSALATGLRNRAGNSEGEFPARIDVRGETIGEGQLTVLTQLEPLAKQPHFLLKVELERVSLPALNDFLRAYGNIDVRAGTFDGYLEAAARDGKFNGYFKPFFQHVDFSTPPGETRPVGREIWETLVRGFAAVFKNHARDQVATRMPFSGEFKDVQVNKWVSFENLVRHAFVQPLKEKLDSSAKPKAE
ncbi:MAG TPA: DUF748 domain-containing protein, partial [Opitutus sp.]|nr:DUF748 domain-containing protein [Opitutus sp.]